MSGWVVAALVLNAALVVVVIALALRIASRGVRVAVEVRCNPEPDLDAAPRLPLFSPHQMRQTEWHALLGALEGARANYLRELVAWRNRQPRTQGALAQSMHDLEVAKRRLQRFEREVCGDLTASPTATGIPAARRPIRKSTSVG